MAQLSFGKKKKRVNYDLVREIIVWAAQIILVCVLAYIFVLYFGFRVSAIGDSMKPELQNGDITLINRLVYDIRKPKRGEIIVFKPNGNESSHYYMKRVIGLPGETVEYRNGKLLIDGEILEEEYETTEIVELGLLEEPIRLASGEFFVLGDDRQNSDDSRTANIGNVKREEIEGKVWFVVSPMRNFGFVK
jgi:signal peptidase I